VRQPPAREPDAVLPDPSFPEQRHEAAPARREAVVLRAVGATVALSSGPLWAYAITRSVVEMDREIVDGLDSAGRAAYVVFWLLLTSLLMFGASFGYFAARAAGWPVLRALRAVQLALFAVSAATLLTAAIR
jgi:hypothetical protein